MNIKMKATQISKRGGDWELMEYPLNRMAEAYQQMRSDKAWFRGVLTMDV